MKNLAIALVALALAAACGATEIEADDEAVEKSNPECTQPCWDTYLKSVDACYTAKEICEWWHSDNWEVCVPPFFKCEGKAAARRDGCLAGCGQTWPAGDEPVSSESSELKKVKTPTKACLDDCDTARDQALDECWEKAKTCYGPKCGEQWIACQDYVWEMADQCYEWCFIYF